MKMACSVPKQYQHKTPKAMAASPSSVSAASHTTTPTRTALSQQPQQQFIAPIMGSQQRGSLPTEATLDLPWPATPVSAHTSNLRMNMMNQNPKDLHTARLIIEELRSKVRYQNEHIMKWRKAYAMQVQQHYRYQKEKTEQMNSLTSQLLLLESRLKRKQKQISSLLNHRELTIRRQQKIIDTLSSRLVDHGLETIEASYATELDSLNDSDSAVVLEDIDSDTNMTTQCYGGRRRSSGSGNCGEGISIARSISDAIETNLNKYGGVRRTNCYLRRPDILETVYSMEEVEEPTSDVAEKRDKFRNRSEKALNSISTEGQIDGVSASTANTSTAAGISPCINVTITAADDDDDTNDENLIQTANEQPNLRDPPHGGSATKRQHSPPNRIQRHSSVSEDCTAYNTRANRKSASLDTEDVPVKTQVTNFNRVMSNHRSVTKPKDVKYKRINKAKSKSLEELRGRLKNLVERGAAAAAADTSPKSAGGNYTYNVMPQTAQSYA